MPTPEWKQRRYKQVWYPGDTVNIGIGQLLARYSYSTRPCYCECRYVVNGFAHMSYALSVQLKIGPSKFLSQEVISKFRAISVIGKW